MRRLSAIDRLILSTLGPLWAVCLVFSVHTALIDAQVSYTMVSGAESPAAHPMVIGFRPYAKAERDLRIGDRLLRVGEDDLRGASAPGVQAIVLASARGPEPLPVLYERDGARREGALAKGSISQIIWSHVPVSLSFGLVALIGLLRTQPSPMMRACILGMMGVAIYTASTFGSSRALAWASLVVFSLSLPVTGALILRALQRFPHGIEPSGRLARHGPWISMVPGIVGPIAVWGFPFALPPYIAYPLSFAWMVVFAITALVVVTRSWRRADPLQRRQLKWFLFGIYAALLPVTVGSGLAIFEPSFALLSVFGVSAAAVFPPCAVIAVVRYDLFDVDRLLSATAAYNAVIVLLLGAGLALVPRVAEATAGVVGLDPATGQVLLSLALAAVIVPAQRRVRPQIERIFFAERHAIDVGIDELLRELDTGAAPHDLTRIAGERLDALLRPEVLVVYALEESAFVPIFARGRALPPAFAAESSLAVALRERGAPLVADRFAESGKALSPFDRAALETLDAAVLLPILRGDSLFAFLCMGPKRSGDIYATTDVNLLGRVAETLGGELMRFEQAQVLREAHQMQESLRRYVPAAVAEQLIATRELESGERDVTVLFVDLRGYTALAEGRGVEEIFSTVNRYTEAVSGIVREHGGSVVEFNGDGMMAVFGAPEPLPDKERAAVRAGRSIVAAVGELEWDGRELSVGVGVATGLAYVGNIQAADRLIWSAIGNTTNLAARLQALSRDLDASIVIDACTRNTLSPAEGADFVVHGDTLVRGRSMNLEVHALPLAGSART